MGERHIVLIPDCHHPFQDKRALRAVIKYIRLTQPHEVCILGDYLDCLAPARWSKGLAAEFAAGLDKEAEEGRATLAWLRAVYGGEITFLEGNHEARIRKYVASVAPALAGIVRMVPELLDFEGFDVRPKEQPYRIAPNTVAIHGDLLSKDAGKSAWKEMTRHGRNVVQGHSHRLGLMFETTDRTRFALECGWLGDVKRAGYLSFKGIANWQQGFGELRVIGERVFPSAVHVQGDTLVAAGRIIRGGSDVS